jgi:transcriptional regulator with XRE-family HTH domain
MSNFLYTFFKNIFTNMNIGLKIKELVNQKKITALELSNKLGKSRQTVYNLMEEAHVSTEVVLQLSKILDLPVTYFFTEGVDLPEVEVGKEQVGKEATMGPDEEKMRLKKALARERKRNDRLLTIIEKQADTLKH